MSAEDGKVTAHTTFQPEVPLVMDESEYLDLRSQGLIVEPAPVADDDSNAGPEPDVKPQTAPRSK